MSNFWCAEGAEEDRPRGSPQHAARSLHARNRADLLTLLTPLQHVSKLLSADTLIWEWRDRWKPWCLLHNLGLDKEAAERGEDPASRLDQNA